MMNAPFTGHMIIEGAEAESKLSALAPELRNGAIVPYLGPELAELAGAAAPTTPEALAQFFSTKVALPRRAKGNAWASAQHIESMKHRNTVTALMNEAFAPKVEPTPLHRSLAALKLPMIVDIWYDSAMRDALAGRDDWGEAQGITRAGIGEDRWFRFYDASGAEVAKTEAEGWTTLLYKPHGAVAPAKNYLISDADYVEVLTEIDIQTPIPDIVKNRRTERSFLFIGCRFHDQMLRTYARQITKRSAPTHHAIVAAERLTKNELKFLTVQGIVPLAIPLNRASEILIG